MPSTKKPRPPRRATPVDHNPTALKQARIRAGWPQNKLAAELGISASALCEAERGTRWLRADVRARLANVLECDPITFEPLQEASS